MQHDQVKISDEITRIKTAVTHAHEAKASLLVNAGHGLTRENVAPIASIAGIHELNIGHAIIADSVFMGLSQAVSAMRKAFTAKA